MFNGALTLDNVFGRRQLEMEVNAEEGLFVNGNGVWESFCNMSPVQMEIKILGGQCGVDYHVGACILLGKDGGAIINDDWNGWC